jgi:hypothetical protein
MPRRLLGFNKTFTIRRRQRAVLASGSITETDAEEIATGVPGTIQPHVLSNLPPPTQRPKPAGLVRVDEYRLWIGDATNSADAQLDDLIEEEGTDPLKVYRVMAVLDEAGRGHHQYLRVESYSQESEPWANQGGEP